MIPDFELSAALSLTRPRQWPILTVQLAVGVILAVSLSATGNVEWSRRTATILAAAWLAWVVLLNGGTLAFNSAYDRDTGPVAYLPKPPVPPRWLAGAAAGAMTGGALLGATVVHPAFGAVIATCVLLSFAYSHPRLRLKARPGLDLLVNMAGYGAGTTLAGLLAGSTAAGTAMSQVWAAGGGWVTLGFACLFGSFYPLTQLYQAEDDRARGDRTLATALGPRRSLDLALVLALAAAIAFGLGLRAANRLDHWLWPALSLGGWSLHLALWRRQPEMPSAQHERSMYAALGLWAVVDAGVVAAWTL